MSHLVRHLRSDGLALPFLEVAIERGVGWQVVRHHFPLTTGGLDVEDAIEKFSKIDLDGMTKAFGLGEQRFENFPLCITQVAGVGVALGVSDFRETSPIRSPATASSLKASCHSPSRSLVVLYESALR